VILAEERTTEEEKMHIIEGKSRRKIKIYYMITELLIYIY
jgi:hypothetical protein